MAAGTNALASCTVARVAVCPSTAGSRAAESAAVPRCKAYDARTRSASTAAWLISTAFVAVTSVRVRLRASTRRCRNASPRSGSSSSARQRCEKSAKSAGMAVPLARFRRGGHLVCTTPQRVPSPWSAQAARLDRPARARHHLEPVRHRLMRFSQLACPSWLTSSYPSGRRTRQRAARSDETTTDAGRPETGPKR